MRLKTIDLEVPESVARAFDAAREKEVTWAGKPYLVMGVYLDGQPRVVLAPLKAAR